MTGERPSPAADDSEADPRPRQGLSVVIPAHNEAAVVSRCLHTLLADGPWHPADEITVVANGCTDDTADEVRRFGDRVRLVELDVASKYGALVAGDETASNELRAYVDADVEVTLGALHQTVAEMRSVDARVGAPAIEVSFDGCAWYARAFYRVWLQLPWATVEPVGSGVYVLDGQGRRKLGHFPAITNDDQYVHDLFAPDERRCARGATFVMHPPRNWQGLVARRTRAMAGTRELDECFGPLPGRAPRESLRSLIRRSPRLATDVPVFVAVTMTAKIMARRKRRRRSDDWERDESSRQPITPPAR